jgi:hypothetical protein
MTQISFKSAGVSARIINLTGPTAIQPSGIPAGVIGTAIAGPAYVPTTVATYNDFQATFGETSNDVYNGPLAVSEWLRNAQSATFIRVLGVGDGNQRTTDGLNRGKVTGAGYVVGGEIPQYWNGFAGEVTASQYAKSGNALGRTYFLGAFMSQSQDSTVFTDAGLSGAGVPIVRGVLFAASGTMLTLSSSFVGNNTPNVSVASAGGAVTGSVNLSGSLQEFVLLVNGLNNPTSLLYRNVITASFDPEARNYFGTVFNRDPLKLEEAGYVLQTDWVIHPTLAVATGSAIIPNSASGTPIGSLRALGYENVAFLVTGSQTRNSGSATAPNYENFEDRFRAPKSPWITSQKFGGKPVNLFRIHSLDDGVYANNKVKFSIQNITPSISDSYLYGTFDLIVRDFTDNDKSQRVLEIFRRLSLDPTSPNYIARVIGDYNTFYNFDAAEGASKLVTVGNYPNNSKYIRVEVADAVDAADVDPTALPVGFRGPAHLVTSGSAPLAPFSAIDTTGYSVANPFRNTVQMPVPFRQNLTRGTAPNKTTDTGLYWGVQFERKISALEPNKTTLRETSIDSFASYFPNFQTDFMNMVVMDNEGVLDTAANGILDADRFNNNAFSLENIEIVYQLPTPTSTVAESIPNVFPDALLNWRYVRNGIITLNTASQTRAFSVADLANGASPIAKFNVYLQGGFDGVNIFNYDETYLTNKAVNEELDFTSRGEQNGSAVVAYNTALDLISDATELDLQLFAIPGIRNPSITDRALQIAEGRFDALYLMDIETFDVENNLLTGSSQVPSVRYTSNNFRDRGINSSFGACYFPDVIMRDTTANVSRQVPSSVVALGAFSFNDAVAFPWFAPAGFARGALSTTERSIIELSRTNMDALYEVDINPIVSFAGSQGLVIWGQKTMYAQQSALDRVNVRRLLLSVRRQVRQVANRILFEQTLPETLSRFSQLVNPILKRVQDQKGVDRFLVRIDTSTTTQADFENKTIRGKIYLQPTRTLEFLSVDFVINNPSNFGQG